MKQLVLSAFAIGLRVAAAEGQPSVVIVDRGPGASGRILAEVLERDPRIVEPDTSWFVLQRGERVRGSMVVLGRVAAIEGQIDGDVVVVGGDLFVRPAAQIAGRAVAIGGGVYPSTLATVGGEVRSFRDNTFFIARSAEGYHLSYQSLYAGATPPVILPGFYGLRMPTYDRVNGASLQFGPSLSFAGGRGHADFLVTYRSDLGRFDPSAAASLVTRKLRFEAFAGRATFTNDAWIWPDYVNSLSSLVLGRDTRNYFRAHRAELTVHRAWEGTAFRLEPFIGARGERSWPVGPFTGAAGSPWSVFGRSDTMNGMRRPNPAVPDLDLLSALAGIAAQWETVTGIRGRAHVTAERGQDLDGVASAFTQLTTDFAVMFLTFGDQQYELEARWVTTPAGAAAPQRFAYVGGSGTLPFHDVLAQGGDELLFLDQRYSVPVARVVLGLLGVPIVQLRHRLGGAGVDRLPSFDQVLSLGVIVSVLRVELQVDPATRDTRVSAGLSLAR